MNINAHTPSLSVIEPRGLLAREVGYCRNSATAGAQVRITRHAFDGVGRSIAEWDPRLWGASRAPNTSSVYSLSGQPLLTDSVDAGWRLGLFGEGGKALVEWDSSGNQHQLFYDEVLRPVSITEQALEVERFTYGSA